MTTNQYRDQLLDVAPPETEVVRKIKNIAQEANDVRRLDGETYKKCPRCYGYHSIRNNFDNLCDPCQQTILEHFQDHESATHIRSAIGIDRIQ